MADKPKAVTVKGNDFRIGKFGARDGSFIALKVGGLLGPVFAPLVQGMDLKKLMAMKNYEDFDLTKVNIAAMFGPLASLSEEDFMYLQDKCLDVCAVKMQSGYVPVVNDNGSFVLEALEDDPMTLMALMVHTLTYNLAGFFSGSPLAGFLGAIPGMSQQT